MAVEVPVMSDKLSKIEPAERPEREAGPDATPKVGEWHWVTDSDGRWLGCVVHVGSNYAEVEGVIDADKHHTKAWMGSTRIHFDRFHERCVREPNPEAYLAARVELHQQRVKALMGEVQELTARLGVGHRDALTEGNDVHALVVQTSAQPVEDYKKALIKAQDKTLPKLFEDIRAENESVALWMTASTIPMKAEAEALQDSLGLIKNRIFTVELYAGLIESVEQFAEGEPAPLATPIHLLQRRCYMDEECLAQYEAGGMDFDGIRDFERWLARPENRDRLLPFPRCVVAFQVRRKTKARQALNLSEFFAMKEMEDADKATFLYLRNGECLYRLQTGVEFDEKLFPDLDKQQLTQPLWAKMWSSGRVERLVTEGEYQDMKRRNAEARERYKKMSPKEKKEATFPFGRFEEPHRLGDYYRYEPNNIYYDDISKYLAEQMAQHNRIVLILQGLLDRSPVFHPHPPWRIYTQAGFETGLKLVFDFDRALVAGEKPDFEAYRNALNGSLKKGSVVIGQRKAWMLHEGKKERARRDMSWRYRSSERYSYQEYLEKEGYEPRGDPGPGLIDRIAAWSSKGRVATFKWNRKRLAYKRSYFSRGSPGDPMPRSFACSEDMLLNLDAYEPGDFKIFFADPRTREEYLQWAPMLLRAEDYKAGKVKVREPGEELEGDDD